MIFMDGNNFYEGYQDEEAHSKFLQLEAMPLQSAKRRKLWPTLNYFRPKMHNKYPVFKSLITVICSPWYRTY